MIHIHMACKLREISLKQQTLETFLQVEAYRACMFSRHFLCDEKCCQEQHGEQHNCRAFVDRTVQLLKCVPHSWLLQAERNPPQVDLDDVKPRKALPTQHAHPALYLDAL